LIDWKQERPGLECPGRSFLGAMVLLVEGVFSLADYGGYRLLRSVFGQFEESFPRGLKPKLILGHSTCGLKPVPFKLICFNLIHFKPIYCS
jgi:hypothetical protein